MGLENYIVRSDKFEADEHGFAFSFPCCVCLNRNVKDTDDPCIHCGHNLLAEIS